MHGTRLEDVVPRVGQPQLRTLTATEEEFNALHRFAKPWMKCFLLLTRGLALRRGEALRICAADMQEDAGTIFFHRKKEGSSNIPLTPQLQAIFQKYAAKPHVPILEAIAGKPVSERMVVVEWIRIRTAAGANPKLTPHDLRRTIAKRVYDLTRDLRVVQALLGHGHPTATLRYVRAFDRDALRNAMFKAQPTIDSLPLASERPQ
jgi:integrase